MKINTITRSAFSYMVAAAAMFFHLRDRSYFVQHANQNIPMPSDCKYRNFREHLEGIEGAVVKIFAMVYDR